MKILVVGYRKELCQSLESDGIPYALWTNKAPKTDRDFLKCHVSELDLSIEELRAEAHKLDKVGPFTHVLAGSEAGVYPASVAREVLGARRTDHDVILRCHDKIFMKGYLSKKKIPMTKFLAVDESTRPDEVVKKLGNPVVLKEPASSGGRGMHILKSPKEIADHLRAKKLAERFVNAEEASVESFVFDGKIVFTNITRYFSKGHTNVVPGCFSAATEKSLLKLNQKVISALKIERGMVHLECYLTKKGPLFGELAIRPPGGHIMELLNLAYGFDPWRAYVAMETRTKFKFPPKSKSVAAAIVLHPGAGRVTGVQGIDELAKHAGIKKYRLKLQVGDLIQKRQSVGEDVGYIILMGKSFKAVKGSIEFVAKNLHFALK